MGSPGYPQQTSHFWTEDDTHWYDRAAHTVPKTYVRSGKQVDPVSIVAELRDLTCDSNVSNQRSGAERPIS